jgi:HlyD family secretion protein
MQVDTNVSESDIGGMMEGKNAVFTVDAYPGESFEGIIKQVRLAPMNVQNVVTYNVVVGVDNRDLRLKPGMTANVSIVVAQRDQVLKIPNAALRFMPPKTEGDRRRLDGQATRADGAGPVRTTGDVGQSKTVWKQVESGDLVVLPIQTGISDGVSTEILSSGLTEGDSVVVGIEQPLGERKANELPPGFGNPKRPRSR